MPFVILTMEFIQPSPAMPSPANSVRIVTAKGLDDQEKTVFAQKHTVHLRQAFTNTHNKGTPLEDMLKDIPNMLNTLETLGYSVVSTTSYSIFKMRDLPEPVTLFCYVWTLAKPLSQPQSSPSSSSAQQQQQDEGKKEEKDE